MEIRKLIINSNLIKHETDRAYLISMPHRSSYDGFAFWFPKKLTYDDGKTITLSIPNGFEFSLSKTDRHFNVIGTDKIDVDDMINQFEGHAITKSDSEESYLIVDRPKKIDRKVIIQDELRND